LGGENEARQNNKLIARSIRWNTDASPEDLQNLDTRRMRAKDIAVVVTRRNMLSESDGGKVANQAVANLIRMEGQNQRDDVAEQQAQEGPQQHLHLHGNANPYSKASSTDLLQLAKAIRKAKAGGKPAQEAG
jgi:hypothetical protein